MWLQQIHSLLATQITFHIFKPIYTALSELPQTKYDANAIQLDPQHIRQRRKRIQQKQIMGEPNTMNNTVEVKIQIKGDIIDTIFVGNMVSMDIDTINNIGIFEISNLTPIQPKVAEKDDRILD